MNRVVVTGIGVIAPNGVGKERFWEQLVAGESYIVRDAEMESMDINSKVLARLQEFDQDKFIEYWDDIDFSAQDRFVQFGLAAGQLAMEDASLAPSVAEADERGIIFSSAIGGTQTVADMFKRLSDNDEQMLEYQQVGEIFYNSGMFNYPAALLAKKYSLQGPCTSLSTGCTAGLDALGLSYELIRSGETKVMLAGASEAPLVDLTYATLDIIGSLSVAECEAKKASRPFDAKRAGFVIGEGAAFLVLEEEQHALARGARIYGEVVSYYSVSNAFHMTDLKADGQSMSDVISAAMRMGGVKPEEIDYINAHGSSTPQNDVFETNAFKRVLGEHAYKVPISSTKSMIGHSLSSASLMGVISALMSINHSVVHPTAHYEFPDPECDLDYVPNEARSLPVNTAMVTASGFGGIHSTAIFRKYGGTQRA
ncbi:beta-ketoacyl-[acyl-carrier-protein] synthase family protein [Laceyella tengchongensis]|jgi:3-oxoacyl-(acyl-carrier-protein) synthase